MIHLQLPVANIPHVHIDPSIQTPVDILAKRSKCSHNATDPCAQIRPSQPTAACLLFSRQLPPLQSNKDSTSPSNIYTQLTPNYNPTSPKSLVKHAICALFAASATRLKSFKNGAVSDTPLPSPLCPK